MVSNEGLRVKARQGCGAAVLQDGRHESGFVLQQTARIIYEMEGQGGHKYVSQRSPPRPLFWADGGVGEESGAEPKG